MNRNEPQESSKLPLSYSSSLLHVSRADQKTYVMPLKTRDVETHTTDTRRIEKTGGELEDFLSGNLIGDHSETLG